MYLCVFAFVLLVDIAVDYATMADFRIPTCIMIHLVLSLQSILDMKPFKLELIN